MFLYRGLAARLPRARDAGFSLRVVYEDGRGILRDVLTACTAQGFTIARVVTQTLEGTIDDRPAVAVTMEIARRPGDHRPEQLTATLDEIRGVHEVATRELDATGD